MSIVGEIYRFIHGKIKQRPVKFQKIDQFVAASGRPMSFREIKWLYNKGMRAILTLTETSLPDKWFNSDWKLLHIPINDHSPPTPEHLDKAVTFIEDVSRLSRPVLIHCAAGVGRTGTVLAAYFIKTKNISAGEAVCIVRQMRKGSIERGQEVSVKNFENYLLKTKT